VLHAELHGKVAPDADDIARREDVLTSTVFGTLFIADAWGVLLEWLKLAKPIGGARALVPPTITSPRTYWFWPRLMGATEPDVLLRAGEMLVLIEAKYLSGKSGTGVAAVIPQSGLEEVTDQLVREWNACSRSADMQGYPNDLREAIKSCARVLVYLVRRSSLAKAIRAVRDSANLVDDASMHILTWEDLDDVLASQGTRWAKELRAYLHRRGVAAFRGFRCDVPQSPVGKLSGWSFNILPTTLHMRAVFSTSQLSLLKGFASRSPRVGRPTYPAAWARIMPPAAIDHLRSLAAWAPTFSFQENAHD